MNDIINLIAIIITSLSMSVHFGTWLTERPMRRTQSGPLFVEVHQGRDEIAAKVMPFLGNAAIIFIAIGVFFNYSDILRFILSLAALIFVILDMVVTLTFNVPINKKVQSWKVDSPPPEWKELRDRWERFHTIRTFLIVTGFSLYTASVVLF